MLRSAPMAKWHRNFTPDQLEAKRRRQREYKARQKAAGISPDQSRIRSDAALEAAILMRGRQLTEMMRTPLCMWPAEWPDHD